MADQIDPRYREAMQNMARSIDIAFNGQKDVLAGTREVGFVLLLFPFGEEPNPERDRCNYISNGAERRDMIVLFKEMIRRFEGQPEIPTTRA